MGFITHLYGCSLFEFSFSWLCATSLDLQPCCTYLPARMTKQPSSYTECLFWDPFQTRRWWLLKWYLSFAGKWMELEIKNKIWRNQKDKNAAPRWYLCVICMHARMHKIIYTYMYSWIWHENSNETRKKGILTEGEEKEWVDLIKMYHTLEWKCLKPISI